jgi:NAD-reducing hydrogenase large subunit
MGLIERYPDIARDGIRLRGFGQEVIRLLGGQSVHPAWTVPGGVREPLSVAKRDHICGRLPEAFAITERAIGLLHSVMDQFQDEINTYGNFYSLFLGLVTPEGGLEQYDGLLRVVDSEGTVLEAGLAPERYREIIGEAVEPWSYLKFPYFRRYSTNGSAGYEQGMYRVGPLARLNVCEFAGTPKADAELKRFRQLAPRGKLVTSSFHYHYARLIEILFSLEKIAETLDNPDITSEHVRARADVNQLVGVGVSEAPRGTLFHEYHVNQQGILENVNLIIATGQNNLAMNRTVKQIAHHYIDGHKLTEGVLNRIEHGIRVFDPCLSCSTHAAGQMPMHVQLVAPSGEIIDERVRD